MIQISCNDIGFPFTREIFEADRVLYHGTSSTWADAIDREGLTLRGFETLRGPAEFLLSTAKDQSITLEFEYDLAQWGLRPRDHRKVISLTPDFWRALNYARNRGGELASRILFSCTELLENSRVVGTIRREIKAVASHVGDTTRGCHPVVYAVETEPEWFDGSWPESPEREREELSWVIEQCCTVDVPAARLLARADYPADLPYVRIPPPSVVVPMDHESAVGYRARERAGR